MAETDDLFTVEKQQDVQYSPIAEVPPQGKSAGQVAAGITNGIMSGATGVVNATSKLATGVAGGVVDGASAALEYGSKQTLPEGAHKPVKQVTEGVGYTAKSTVGGINKAVTNTTSGLRDAVHGTTNAAADGNPAAFASGLGTGVGRTVIGAGQGIVCLQYHTI